jgi:hypothetical protein
MSATVYVGADHRELVLSADEPHFGDPFFGAEHSEVTLMVEQRRQFGENRELEFLIFDERFVAVALSASERTSSSARVSAKMCTVPLSLLHANHRDFASKANEEMVAYSEPLRSY